MLIGLSISESPDLARLGFGPQHLRDAMVEVARHLLVAGHSVAYGGDLRSGGFTETLREVARGHGVSSARPRIFNYLAWPIHLHTSDSELAGLAGVAVVEKLKAPTPVVDGGKETRFARVRAMTDMRLRMTRRIDARVLLGGKLSGFGGIVPGLAEEGVLALEKRKPLYLIGAFGGCTRELIEGIRTRKLPSAFAETAFEDGLGDEEVASRRALLLEFKTRMPSAPSLDMVRQAFATHGLADVGSVNRLSVAENEILFQSPNIPELVALVLRGLARVGGRAKRQGAR